MSCPTCFTTSKVPNIYPKRKYDAGPSFLFQPKTYVRIIFYAPPSFNAAILEFGDEVIDGLLLNEYYELIAKSYTLCLRNKINNSIIAKETYLFEPEHYYTIVILEDRILYYPENTETLMCPPQRYNRVLFHNKSIDMIDGIYINNKLFFDSIRPSEMIEINLEDGFYDFVFELSLNKNNVALDLHGNVIINILYLDKETETIVLINEYCIPQI